MNLLIYLQTVSRKWIKISHVYYGMLEVRELGYAPVTELNNILEISKGVRLLVHMLLKTSGMLIKLQTWLKVKIKV